MEGFLILLGHEIGVHYAGTSALLDEILEHTKEKGEPRRRSTIMLRGKDTDLKVAKNSAHSGVMMAVQKERHTRHHLCRDD